MSSQRKIAANRANALHSTGPDNTERSKYNATRHGLSGKQVVVQGEDPAAYEALRQGLIDSHRPANTAEAILVEEIAQSYWRLRRARIIEAETFRINGAGADPVIAFSSGVLNFDQIRRYMTTIERAYHRAIVQLEKTQAIRARKPVEASSVQSPLGFVSQDDGEKLEIKENTRAIVREIRQTRRQNPESQSSVTDFSGLREPQPLTH